MFLAFISPGILLAAAKVAAVFAMDLFLSNFVGDRSSDDRYTLTWSQTNERTLLAVGLILVVLGGIYTGRLTRCCRAPPVHSLV